MNRKPRGGSIFAHFLFFTRIQPVSMKRILIRNRCSRFTFMTRWQKCSSFCTCNACSVFHIPGPHCLNYAFSSTISMLCCHFTVHSLVSFNTHIFKCKQLQEWHPNIRAERMKQQNKQIYKTNIEKNRQRDRIKIEIKTNQPNQKKMHHQLVLAIVRNIQRVFTRIIKTNEKKNCNRWVNKMCQMLCFLPFLFWMIWSN